MSSYFNSYPNAMRSKVFDIEIVDGMNKHIVDKLKKQLSQKQNLLDELIDVFETDRKNAQATIKIQNATQSRQARTKLKQNKEL
jgi:hypothetical protein